MHDPQSFHNEGWRATGDRTRLYHDPTTPERQQKLRRYLGDLKPGSRVLDYGCGRGEFTNFLASLGFRGIGLDLAQEAIELNRRDFPHLEFVHIDAGSPAPFENGFFDAIWCSEVIEHVYDVHAIFSEFSRLLRIGGRLLITTPYHGWLKNILLVTFAFDRHFNVEWQHIRFWTKGTLRKIPRPHGLKPVAWDTIGRFRWLAKSFFVVFERLP